MTASVLLHEVLGHVGMGLLCGGRSIYFAVTPGFAGLGTAGNYHDGCDWLVRYAGIAANALTAIFMFAFLRFRQPNLSLFGLIAFWLAVTQSGHAIGYTIQGLVFRQGDAANLPDLLPTPLRLLLIALLAGMFILLAAWALSGIAGFVHRHFETENPRSLRRMFASSFSAPIALIVFSAPRLPMWPLWTKLLLDAAVVTVVAIGTVLVTRRMPRGRDDGRPVSALSALSWAAAAAATFLVTWLWLSKGVSIDLS